MGRTERGKGGDGRGHGQQEAEETNNRVDMSVCVRLWAAQGAGDGFGVCRSSGRCVSADGFCDCKPVSPHHFGHQGGAATLVR